MSFFILRGMAIALGIFLRPPFWTHFVVHSALYLKVLPSGRLCFMESDLPQ